MEEKPWMLYGATGYTGRMIAERAVALGHRPVLAGRSRIALEALATRLGLPYRVIALEDRSAVEAELRAVSLVCNAAGPFENTADSLMQAAVRARCHYVDIANEISVFQMARAADGAARTAGVALVPGVGFGVSVTSCLTRFVLDLTPDAVKLECGSAVYTAHNAPGVMKTVIGLIVQGGAVVRNGELRAWPLGSGAIRVAFPDGERLLTPIPTGDLEAASWMTGIPDVTVYSADLPGSAGMRAGFAFARLVFRNAGVRRFVER
ncbi:MAG: saccharopine dehydrogenase NADP-binding domain-containing protein, partial [Sulfobacillus sp.]